jgi:hypothetical protein
MNSNDFKLSDLLRESRQLPALPPRFQDNVWRRIEVAEVPVKSGSWLDAFVALLLRPRFALATVTALVLVGVSLGTYEGAHTARQTEQARYLAMVAPDSLR